MSAKASQIQDLEIEASSVKKKIQGWKYAPSWEVLIHYAEHLLMMTWMETTTKITGFEGKAAFCYFTGISISGNKEDSAHNEKGLYAKSTGTMHKL